MDARSKRREATRRQLEQQLKERQAREARRKRATLIGSIIGTVAVVALVVILVAVFAGGSNDKSTNSVADKTGKSTAASSPAASSSAPAVALAAPKACAAPTGKITGAYDGVTVGQATNLKHEPKVTSKSATTPGALACADLVVGKGKAATPTSTVQVQYTGVLYSNGKQFDSSWARGQSASFSLSSVVAGFTQGIGGTGKVTPMRVGGRRIMVLPASLGYGSAAQQGIPANSPLVFVVDLLKVT